MLAFCHTYSPSKVMCLICVYVCRFVYRVDLSVKSLQNRCGSLLEWTSRPFSSSMFAGFSRLMGPGNDD